MVVILLANATASTFGNLLFISVKVFQLTIDTVIVIVVIYEVVTKLD